MYEITIRETKVVTKTCGNDWEIVNEDADGNKRRGYTPEIEKQVEVTEMVYAQVVEELDLVGVINAVNRPPVKNG